MKIKVRKKWKTVGRPSKEEKTMEMLIEYDYNNIEKDMYEHIKKIMYYWKSEYPFTHINWRDEETKDRWLLKKRLSARAKQTNG